MIIILPIITMVTSLGVASLMATFSQIRGWKTKLAFWLPVGGYVLATFLVYALLYPYTKSAVALSILSLLSVLGILSAFINIIIRLAYRDRLSKSLTQHNIAQQNNPHPLEQISSLQNKQPSYVSEKPQNKPRMEQKDLKPKKKPNTGQIFISYRRSDSADVAGRIYDRLVGKFGKGPIFKDVDSIPLGLDFKEYLDQKVGECDVLLAIIGDHWADASDSTGKSRLHDPVDFVRIEIQSALERGIPVIPLLVRGAQMPIEETLPIGLRKLVFRNGIPIRSDPDFHRDMDRLIAALEKYVHREK